MCIALNPRLIQHFKAIGIKIQLGVWGHCEKRMHFKGQIIEFEAIFLCLETSVFTSLFVYKPAMISVLMN